MKKNSFVIQVFIICVLVVGCSKPSNAMPELERSSLVEQLYEHSSEFDQAVYSYPNGIHAAVGFGVANSYLVEGINHNIIIDATDSTFQAEKVYTKFQAINSNPIAAIIYTHNHGDHTFGARYFVDQQAQKPLIISHESTSHAVEKIFGILNPIISTRTAKMFGTQLPEDELVNVGIGPYLSVGASPPGYVKPTLTFEDELQLNIAGIKFEIFHAPGETSDQLFVWLPEFKALFPGDNIYKTFPNLYTIRGTSHRDVQAWIDSLDHMISFEPEHLYPSHTLPISGQDVSDALSLYRDGIQFVHDQTIRLMNQGLYPEQIIERIQLPETLAASPYLREFYGTIRWSVKSIFNGYLGWFSGNIAELDPTPLLKRAQFISDMAGGAEALFNHLEVAVANTEMQWALELADLLDALNYQSKQVNSLRYKATYHLGKMASNPNKRNYFLSEAQTLAGTSKPESIVKPKAEMLAEIPMDMFFSVLSVNLDPSNVSAEETMHACFEFSSGTKKTLTLRNQVAKISNEIVESCDLMVKSDEQTFKEILAGIKNPVQAIASGDLVVDQEIALLQLLMKFRP